MTDRTMRDRFGDRVKYDVAKLIVLFAISSSGGVVAAQRVTATVDSLRAAGWPVGIASTAIFLLGGYKFLARLDRLRPTYSRIRADFVILRKEVEYTYVSRTEIQYVKRITLKARRHGLDAYMDKFHWSGAGPMTIASLVPEHTIDMLGHRNIWRLYRVSFGRALAKNDVIEIAIRWELKDPHQTAVPFFSQSVNEPTALLTFLLRLPESFSVRRVTATILPTIEFLTPVEAHTEDMKVRNGFAECEWTIKRPKLLHCYQMSWTDPGATPKQVVLAGPQYLEGQD
jgi:hypothetical protein